MSIQAAGPLAGPRESRPQAGTATPAQSATAAGERPPGAQHSVRSRANAQILQASLEVSLKSGDQALALLFRSAIDRINEHLAPELGPDAIQAAAAHDYSPEATAERILSASTGFFDAYAAQHPDTDAETAMRDFVALIRGGFEQGFADARGILEQLGVLGGEVEAGIMKTHDLVQRGLDDFLAARLAPGGPAPQDAPPYQT